MPRDGWRSHTLSEEEPGGNLLTFTCQGIVTAGLSKAWQCHPEEGAQQSITELQETASYLSLSLDHYSHSFTVTAMTSWVSKTEIFSSSYYIAIPFSSVFFTSKSILTQCIFFFVSLTDGFKDSQCCIVNNFSVARLFPISSHFQTN